jgi:hypothetical protein
LSRADQHRVRADGAELWRARGSCAKIWTVALLVAEQRVVQCLATVNLRGVAASRQQLTVELRRRWPAAARNAKTLKFFLRLRHLDAARRKWADGHRRRWGISFRRLPARPSSSKQVTAVQVRGAKMCKEMRPQIWGRFWGPPPVSNLRKCENVRPFVGTKNGPTFRYRFWSCFCFFVLFLAFARSPASSCGRSGC